MPINILMPALSPTMEKGNLAKWLKKEGEKVKPGDVIAEIETDKATMEVEAVDEGMLAKIVVPEGTADVPVNQLIAVLAGEGEDAKAAGAARQARPRRSRLRQPKGACSATRPAAREGRQRRSPLARAGDGGAAQPRRAGRPTATPACSRRRSRAGSPRKPASISRASPAPARTAAWSRATSRPRRTARG